MMLLTIMLSYNLLIVVNKFDHPFYITGYHRKIKVALNPFHRIFKLCKKLNYILLITIGCNWLMNNISKLSFFYFLITLIHWLLILPLNLLDSSFPRSAFIYLIIHFMPLYNLFLINRFSLSISLPARHDERARQGFACRKGLSKRENAFVIKLLISSKFMR